MNDAEELISKMSKNEKRYFKLNNSNQNEEIQTIILFDFFNKSYRKADISSLKINQNNINYLNHILYDQLLASLNSYNKNKVLSIKLLNTLTNVKTLITKGLFSQAIKQVRKGKKLCTELDDSLTMLQFISFEKEINKELFKETEFLEQIQESYYRETRLIDNLSQEFSFRQKELFTTFIARTLGFEKSDAAKIQYNEIKLFLSHNNYEDCKTFNSKRMHLYIEALFEVYNKNYAVALEKQEEIITLFEKKPKILSNDLTTYLGSIYNACVTNLYLKQFEQVQEKFNKMNDFRSKSNIRILDLKLFNYLGMEIALQNSIGQFQKTNDFEVLVKSGMQRFSKEIHITAKLFTFFQLGLAYFGEGNYLLAKNRLNKVIYDEHATSFPRIIAQSHLLSLFILFEKKNYDKLKNQATLILQEEIKTIVKYPKLHLFFDYFSTSENFQNEPNLKRLLSKLDKQLAKEKSEEIITDIHLRTWVLAKINNTSYANQLKTEK